MRKPARAAMIAGVVLFACLVPVVARALQGRGASFSAVDRQDFRWRTEAVTTSSKEYRAIPGLALSICNRGGATITLSGNASGGRADVRLTTAPTGNKPLPPGSAHFGFGTTSQAFSFTFGSRASKAKSRSLYIQWRSPTGAEITLQDALARVLYHEAASTCQ